MKQQYKCNICGYIYNPIDGDEFNNINAGVQFESISADWTCPICGASKNDFSRIITE